MNQIKTKSSVASNVLLGMIVAAAMIFSGNRAEAAQLPANCTANNLSYNINNLYGLVNVTNGTVVTFVTSVSQPSDPTTCNIIISNLVFFCADANGNPTVAQLPVLIPGPNAVLPPSYSQLFTNQCAINVNPGVLTAVVKLQDSGAMVEDNPLKNDGAAIVKTLSVNIFSPCIQVTKQCNGGPFVYGQPISFAGTVTNCGDVMLGNVTVVDDQAGILISGLVLQAGQGTNFTANYNPSGNLCGPFTNNVTATGIAPLSILATVSSTASAVCTVISSPCISVTKTCPTNIVYGTTSYVVGGVVNNCGNVPLVGVTVVDETSTGNITIPIGPLAIGGSATYSATNTVPVGCGPFTDTVVASGVGQCGGAVSATNSCTTQVTTTPCIAVTKTCPTNIVYGTTSYVVGGVVNNCGNVPLVGVTVVDETSTGNITIPIGPLAIGGSATYSATNTVPVGCGPFTDTVVATGTNACNGSNVTHSASCTTTVTTAPCISVTKVCPVEQLPVGTTSFVVTGIVANCGNVPLTNVVVVDDNGTTSTADDITISIGSLAVGGSAPWQANNTVSNGFCGPVTDQVTASGNDACSGAPVSNKASCTTTIICPAPKICVTKGIICAPANGVNGCNSSLTYGPTATGMAGTNQTAFCYQIIVANCGLETLTNVQVTDSLLPGVASTYPTTLIPGQSVTNYYGQSYGLHNGGPSTNVNTATAVGTGQTSLIVTQAQASATAIVLPISVSCSITLFSSYDMDNNTNDNKVTLPADATNNTPVEFTLTVNNTGQADLTVSLNGLPPLVDCGDDVTPLITTNPVFVAAGTSVQLVGCVLVTCPGIQINATVQGTAATDDSILCIYDSFGNVVTTAPSSCSATVICQKPVSCRVTGGGTLQPGNTDTNCIIVETTLFDDELPAGVVVDHISHGGQLGAPFSQQDCGEILGNPCIRGEWQHTRHYTDNTADVIDMSFHSANPKGVFDTLMCACLGCCGPTVDQPNGKFLGVGKKFTLCNPDDHRVCGPMPRPAPANAIIFTGIGTFKPGVKAHGKDPKGGTTYMVFRVYIEDRSEPGGNHPKGANEPADVYSFQAWDTGVAVVKKPDYSTIATAFRQALAADSCAFIQSISTPSQIINGVVVGGVPPGTLPASTIVGVAADIVDQGPVWGGNQQIHPSTGATCN